MRTIHGFIAARHARTTQRAGASARDLRRPGRPPSRPRQDWEAMVMAGRGLGHAVRCRVCGVGLAPEGENCPYCNAVVHSVLGRGAPLPAAAMAEINEERRARRLRHEKYEKERRRRHSLIGAAIFALCGLGSAAATFCLFMVHQVAEIFMAQRTGNGLLAATAVDATAVPSLHAVFTGLALAFLLAAIVGPAAGYLVSHLRRGMGLGGLVGACAFGLSVVLVNPVSVPGGAGSWSLLILLAAISALPGALAGLLLGWHVSSEPL